MGRNIKLVEWRSDNCIVRHEMLLKNREEFAESVKDARSIGAYNQPVKPEYIGSSATENNIYHYYRDIDGRYYFQCERTLQFDKMIKAHRKGRKKL